MKIDESQIGGWLGGIYVLICLVGWIPIDLWLHRHHHEYITTEVREILEKGGIGGIIFVMLVGAVVALALYHFFYERQI